MMYDHINEVKMMYDHINEVKVHNKITSWVTFAKI